MISSPEGAIGITLTRRGDRLVAVSIRSTRPQLAQKLLQGRDPEAAARIVGIVFSLCGRAQRIACEAACEVASEVASGGANGQRAAREQAVLREMAREHVWRLMLNWPQQAALPHDPALLARLNHAAARDDFADVLERGLAASVLGEAPEDWRRRDLAGFDAWVRAAATPTAALFAALPAVAEEGAGPLLPALGELDAAAAQTLARQALEQPEFSARPLWHGLPAETGALARLQHTPLLAAWQARQGRGSGARMLARLLELAAIPARLRGEGGADLVRAWPIAPDTGLAGVETSRGLLLHGVRLDGGKIADYRIVAPTEWNFHPAGALRTALAGLEASGDLAGRARLLAQSLDPCVEYQVEVLDQPTGDTHA